MNSPQPPAQVPAAKNVLSVLRYVAAQAGPVGAAAIARDVGLPRSTTYHLLAALVDDGFVVHLPEERKYALGVTAHELGTGYSRQAPLQRIARFPIAQLVARTRRTAHLAVMHGREVIYVIEERAKRQNELVTDAGVRLPAHLTASGRAMLASMSAAQLAALYPGPEAFPTRYENGVHSVEALNELLARIRERGFSWEQDEVTDGFSSLAVPVVDRSGYAVASVTLTVANRPALSTAAAARHAAEGLAPERTVQLEDLATQWLPEVKRCAAEISRRLRPSGYVGRGSRQARPPGVSTGSTAGVSTGSTAGVSTGSTAGVSTGSTAGRLLTAASAQANDSNCVRYVES